MYLIDATYFTRELQIPNASAPNSGAGEELNLFIDDKVRLFLQRVLGSVLFTSLDGDIEDGSLKNDAAQKWKDLVDGKTYTKDDKTRVWRGLIYQNGLFKSSLLATFVYHEWLSFQFSQMVGVGEVSAQAKNAVTVNSTQRLVTVWNDFVEKYQGNFCENKDFYYHQNVPVFDYYRGGNADDYVSLVQFLKDNDTDYPDAPCPILEFKNQLGL